MNSFHQPDPKIVFKSKSKQKESKHGSCKNITNKKHQLFLYLEVYQILRQIGNFNIQKKMSTMKNSLNNSVSKANYSFPRAARLPQLKSQDFTIYTLPSTVDKRATSMGFGKKTPICKDYKTPSPDQYNKQSIFALSPSKGLSFGLGRNQIKAVNLLPQTKTPGPGAYENTTKQTPKNYSMVGRDGFPEIFPKKENPGPGRYQTGEDMLKRVFNNSRKKNSQFYTIKPEHREKENKYGEFELGPGKYKIGADSMGKQLLGSKKTQTAFIFPRDNRKTFEVSNITPGPGNYTHFTQFGN